MNLIKTSILSIVATAVRTAAGLAVSKSVAVYAGPAGIAMVGAFQNFIQLILMVAKGALDTGITKYVAEYGGDHEKTSRLLSTAMRVSLVTSMSVAIGLFIGANYLAQFFLLDIERAYIIQAFGLTLMFFVFNHFILAILHGLQEIKIYIILNITQSFATFSLTLLLVLLGGIDGALIALVLNQSLVTLILFWTLRRHRALKLFNYRAAFSWAEFSRLARFSLMSIVGAIASPAVSILVRNSIAAQIGLAEAGYWQAVWFVSSNYLTIVTTALTLYFLPKMSATSDKTVIRSELKRGYFVLMPMVAVGAFVIYSAREVIILVFFTPEFSAAIPLFKWMMVGDVVKIASWLLAYLMISKAMTLAFISTEILFSVFFVLLVKVLIAHYGLEGAAYAHLINYLVYLTAVAWITKRYWI